MQFLRSFFAVFVIFTLVIAPNYGALAQSSRAIIPNYWDENVRILKPQGFKLARLRFLTTTDFPPFNFIDRDKRLNGFHIDLARHICKELDILRLCQIQALPWNELDAAIEKGDGEAIITGLEKSANTDNRYDFSRPFLKIPARFATLRKSQFGEPMVNALYQKKTGVIKNSSHAKYFQTVFSNRQFVEFDSFLDATKALQDNAVDVIFSDAVSLAFWLPSKPAANCCRFVGGPYISNEYFGEGLTIAVAKGNPEFVTALNFALNRINANGTFRELYLRYFPVGLY